MTTSSRIAVADSASTGWRGDDFPGWLSPMLVKELRQGIQSGAFAWTFIGLQAVMFLVMATALAGGVAAGRDATAWTFWLPVAVAVAVVIPLRGLGAVASEKTGNNLDLVRLTHLSATRIVVGKWLAIVAQSALLATAALPYLVLRYFFGGVNVVADLVAFGWLLAAAMLVAAAAVAASTRSVRERVGVVILLFFFGNGALQAMFFSFGIGAGIRFPPLVGLALVGLYIVIFLEHAASVIAPPAENHAGRKRIIGLAIAAAWVGAGLFGGRNLFWIVAGGTIVPLVAMAVEALCERPSRLDSIHAPFARRGSLGGLAALVFTPGWATGLVFASVVAAACLAGVVAWTVRFIPNDAGEILAIAVLLCATVVYPLPAVVAFLKTPRRHAVYAAVQIACLFVLILDGLLGAQIGGAAERPVATVALFPLAALLRALGASHRAQYTLAMAAAVVTLVVFGLVAGPWVRELTATWRQVAAARDRRVAVPAESAA
jgi:hypothetical protein